MTARKVRWMILALVILSYIFMYTQTKKDYLCNDDCQKIYSIDTTLVRSRSYIYNINRCSRSPISDTVCVFVKDTSGINWELLADTTCIVSSQNGLLHQKVFIIGWHILSQSYDTLVKRQCP